MANSVRVDGWSLRRLDGRSIDAVLEEEGGLFVRDLGGPGGVKTVSLRNAPATHTVFQINGMRLNSPQNSLVDVGLYPVELFDAVEVVRGGQSTFLGADANAGAVLLGVWPSFSDRASVRTTGGSFGLRGVTARWDASYGRLATSVRAGGESAEGRFSFPWNDSSGTSIRQRDGSSHRRWFAAASAVFSDQTGGQFEAMLLGVTARRGSPGPVTSAPTPSALLKDDVFHGVVRWVEDRGERSAWEIGLSGSLQDEVFDDPSASVSDDRYESRLVATWAHWRSRISDGVQLGGGGEASIATLDSRNLSSAPRRSAGAVMAHVEWTMPETSFRLLPSMRLDLLSDQRPFLSPRLAGEFPWPELPTVVARASVGSGVRMPNFNELYWRPGGNPLLLPERVTTVEAGVSVDAVEGYPSGAVTVFVADTRNRITGWPPVNLTRTFSRGLDLNSSWYWFSHRWWMNCTMASVELRVPLASGRQAPYVPRWIASTGFDIRLGILTVSPTIRYVSRRFTTLDNLAALSVPPSVRTSVAGRMTFLGEGYRLLLDANIDNLLNVSGTALPGYPLPGRSLRMSATIEFNHHRDEKNNANEQDS